MLRKDPAKRIDMMNIKEHPWIKKYKLRDWNDSDAVVEVSSNEQTSLAVSDTHSQKQEELLMVDNDGSSENNMRSSQDNQFTFANSNPVTHRGKNDKSNERNLVKKVAKKKFKSSRKIHNESPSPNQQFVTSGAFQFKT